MVWSQGLPGRHAGVTVARGLKTCKPFTFGLDFGDLGKGQTTDKPNPRSSTSPRAPGPPPLPPPPPAQSQAARGSGLTGGGGARLEDRKSTRLNSSH